MTIPSGGYRVAMESIYYVLSYLCHRTCPHCYDDRFRPYHGPGLHQVVHQALDTFPRVIANLPPRLTYLDRAHPAPDGSLPERTGSVILAGGEILLDPVREPVLYKALELLKKKYRFNGGVKLIVQTTGDVLTPVIAAELMDLGVWCASISGIDSWHQGLEEEPARIQLINKCSSILNNAGFEHMGKIAAEAHDLLDDGRYYHFFGATPDSWIGPLWPRGRAMRNSLTTATLADNYCARWSGGIHFLDTAYSGSEVSIEPDGSVYPCCIKTKQAIGNVSQEPLLDILSRLRGNPVYEAINRGQPQLMGLSHGWTEQHFLDQCRATLPDGREYANLCIGCDRFHEQVLSSSSALVNIR